MPLYNLEESELVVQQWEVWVGLLRLLAPQQGSKSINGQQVFGFKYIFAKILICLNVCLVKNKKRENMVLSDMFLHSSHWICAL